MKICQLLENYDERRAGFKKGNPLSNEIADRYVIVYRAQPIGIKGLNRDSYVTRSRKFAIDHAVSSANYEDETFHVIRVMVKTSDVYNAENPDEYIYGGAYDANARSIFVAKSGDDFPE